MLRVMARRPHNGHGRAVRSGHDAFNAVDDRARRQQRDLIRLRRRVRVRVERRRFAGRLRNAAHVIGVMHTGQLLACRTARRDDIGALRAPPIDDDVHDFGTLGSLGMPGRRLVLGKPLRVNENQRHGKCWRPAAT
jgi:hypothetical protein